MMNILDLYMKRLMNILKYYNLEDKEDINKRMVQWLYIWKNIMFIILGVL